MTGYFVGEPITYTSADEAQQAEFSAIYNYNDEAFENSDLAKDASIFGVGYELLYLDDNKDIRFKRISPIGCIPIYENNVEEELLYFIRYYDEENIVSGDVDTFVEVYSRTYYQLYKYSVVSLSLLEENIHSWGLVPISIYRNNTETMGDFENVISLIDAMDKLESDNLNEIEYFSDAYLCITGCLGTDSEDIQQMKENRVILLPENTSASWLVKGINDTYIENQKTRIDADIHKFSYCPAMTDRDFAVNASGVAMKYKLMGLEAATAKKENAFKLGLQRRIELICNILAVFGKEYDYRALLIHFKRNVPQNMNEVADLLNKVGHLLSEETQINLLPLNLNPTEELEKRKQEADAGYIDFGDGNEE